MTTDADALADTRERAYRIFSSFIEPRRLGRLFSRPTAFRIGTNPGVLRHADLLFVPHGKAPAGPLRSGGPLETLPDLIVETVGSSHSVIRAVEQASRDVEAGVVTVLLIHPATRCVAVFRADEWPVRLHNGDELTLPDVLPGFAVPVKRFFE